MQLLEQLDEHRMLERGRRVVDKRHLPGDGLAVRWQGHRVPFSTDEIEGP
jgi:hypothetical protein